MTKKPGRQPDSKCSEINVTPLIDVLLVLLIIFMVITPLKPHQLESKVPERSTPEPNVVSFASVIAVSGRAACSFFVDLGHWI